MADQTETPLLTALAIAANRSHTPFYAPGHKQGQGVLAAFQALVGDSALRADLPELPELDNLFSPAGPIRAAQALAAAAFGADETYFLANGSTCGIEAAVLAVCSPGDKILVPRNAHQSVWAALVLSGALPVYCPPLDDQRWDLALGITAQQVEQALVAHPDLSAVLVVSPSYHGVCSDLEAIAQCVHAHGAVLVVDEAHGAHLGFHEQLPQSAIAAGADLAIQSTHKTLAALSQASMLHVQGQRVNCDRLRQALRLTQSTSPNSLLLASLDAARQQMATTGGALLARTLEIGQRVRSRLSTLPPLAVFSPSDLRAVSEHFQLDMTRLVVDVSGLGITGFTADEFLHEALGVTAELPTLRQLAFILSYGNTEADGDRLIQALQTLVARSPSWEPDLPARMASPPADNFAFNVPLMTPREAFFAVSRTVSLAAAVGEICADIICPYPPGIPVLLPGEVITEEAIAHLQNLRDSGATITGGSDAEGQMLRTIPHPH